MACIEQLRHLATARGRLAARDGQEVGSICHTIADVLNATHDLAFVEWDPKYQWAGDELSVAFCEYYDLLADPLQLTNLCTGGRTPPSVRRDLHAQLDELYHCRGSRVAPSNCP